MATVAPMAEWRPFTGKTRRSLVPDIVCVHTMVGTLSGSWSWANQPGNPYWHFGLGGDGRLWQCVDLAYRSAANLEGNYHVIPIETADKGAPFPAWSGSNVPAWTPAQIDKLIDLCTWLCKRFEIPPVLIPDTRPGRRGLAYHRQGIDPWRVAGGEKWSNATGKRCPGDRRLVQFRDVVVPRVAAAVAGIPTPVPPEDDLDATQAKQLAEIHAAVYGAQGAGALPRQVWATEVAHLPTQTGAAADLLRKIHAATATAGADVDEAAVAAAILAVLTPVAIAAAIPTELAGQVADELHDRLAG